jgi:hypothetical protein
METLKEANGPSEIRNFRFQIEFDHYYYPEMLKIFLK